jgi:hypothetical protein
MTDTSYVPQPDPAVFERLRATHDRSLTALNELDPQSPVYGRPDLAKQYRERAEQEFTEICAKYGVVAPPPKNPEEIREEKFNAGWQGGLGERQQELIGQEIDRLEALDPAARAHQIAELRKELGDDYDGLVADARAAYPGQMPEAALASKFVLLNLQAVRRYENAHSRARTAAGFGIRS